MCASVLFVAVHCNLYFDSHSHSLLFDCKLYLEYGILRSWDYKFCNPGY